MFSSIKRMFTWEATEKQARQIALEIEQQVYRLNGLSPQPDGESAADLPAILNSANLLLKRISAKYDMKIEVKTSELVAPSATSKAVPINTPPVPVAAPEPAPSKTALELIKLRDWVLMAKTSGNPVNSEGLENFYKQLGRILGMEGITPIEDQGVFDYNRQQIMDSRTTDDPALQDHICETVRPGYQFHEKLIRPQEVIVYVADGG
jgi:hypothetical protein